MWAPTWNWVLVANVLLGVSQGLTWSTTVIMKIDLAGPQQRGLAMGLNEFAGYIAVAASALATGYIAARYGLRPAAVLSRRRLRRSSASLLSVGARPRDARPRRARSRRATQRQRPARRPSARSSCARRFAIATCRRQPGRPREQPQRRDGVGSLPAVLCGGRAELGRIGWLAAIYPASWGVGQLVTGALSDRSAASG